MNLMPFNYHDKAIRVVKDEVNGEAWFLVKDVCLVLGFKNPRQAVLTHCDKEDVQNLDTPSTSGIQQMKYVNESGMYALIFGSTLESAKPFKRWVPHEVLPTIRKNGAYMDNELKKAMEQFIPKNGFLEENPKGEIKTKAVRGYYRVDKNSRYGQLLTRRHQLQKRLNGFFIEEIKFELAEIEGEIAELVEGITK